MKARTLIKSAAGAALGSVIAERTAGKGLLGAGLGLIATRLATRSIPGAALVGGALVAKALYDRRRERKHLEAAIPPAIEIDTPPVPQIAPPGTPAKP
ncbi:MAG TPA: hypothetical protein VGN36_04860 [Sphingorhabdus sp.]|jgi:hypothetical protein|nr:hypothetical protein [Sphingorhabdus sp.]